MDKYRPRYHFRPPANWINDPNGLIQWQGLYHLYYQYNPGAAVWGNMHWGHAESPDLVHWKHLPVALAPTPGSTDADGVWSGCAVDWNGTPTFVYTGRLGWGESVCLATSQDSSLRAWAKHPGNPVIPGAPEGQEWVGFRDPCVWKEGETWWMVIGSGIRDVGGAILLYSSPNLIDWTYHGPMIVGDSSQHEPVWTGEMWECPNFFPLGDRWVLLISAMDLSPSRSLYTLCFTGMFEGGHFTPESVRKLDGGDIYYYAPQAFKDEAGRRVIFGWAREARTIQSQEEAGWAGVMSLPRLLEWHPSGWMNQRPAPEVELLRGEGCQLENLRVEPDGSPHLLEGVSGDTLELDLVFDLAEVGPERDGALGLVVLASPGGEEQTEIRCDLLSKRLVVNTIRSSTSKDAEPGVYEIPLELDGQDHLHMRVFLDRSIIEVYINDREAITARVYPTREDSTGIALFAERRPVIVERLQSWQMQDAQ